MGYVFELNGLLRIPTDQLDLKTVKLGETYTIKKAGERFYPLNIPLEFCDEDYRYFGKAVIRKLSLQTNQTELNFEVLKLFSDEEAKVFSDNFIRPDFN